MTGRRNDDRTPPRPGIATATNGGDEAPRVERPTPHQGVAALGILLGTYLASIGTVAVVAGLAERDPRGALGLAPLIGGGLFVIASTGSLRRPGSRGTFLVLPRALDLVVRVLVIVSTTLIGFYGLFLLLVSDARLVASPEWQAENPLPLPPWPHLVDTWLVGGGMVAFFALNLVLVRSMGLLVIVGLINGALVAVAGLGSHMTTRDPIAPFVVFAGLIGMAVSIALWQRRRRGSEVLGLPQAKLTDVATDTAEDEQLGA
jgi:hypothetical protein